jgi:hypothetical protein
MARCEVQILSPLKSRACQMFPVEPRGLPDHFCRRNPEGLKNEDTFSDQHRGRPGFCYRSIRAVAELEDHRSDHAANAAADDLSADGPEVTRYDDAVRFPAVHIPQHFHQFSAGAELLISHLWPLTLD